MDVFKRFLPYLKPYWPQLLVSALCMLLATPCSLFHPLVWKYIVDEVISEGKHGHLLPALGIMTVVHATGFGLNAFRNYILGKVGQLFIYDLRNSVYQKLQRQSLSFFHDNRAGDLIARAVNDVDAVEQVVIHGVDNVIGNLLSFVYVSFIIITIQPVVGSITLIPILIVGALIWSFNSRIKAIYKRVRTVLGDVTAMLQENLTGMMTIKAFAREPHETERFEEQNGAYREIGIKAAKVRALYFPSVFTFGFLSNVIMVGLGGWFVIKGKMSIGGLVAYRGYWWQLFSPIQSIATINEMLQRAAAAGSRIFELLDQPEAITDPEVPDSLSRIDGKLEFRDVDFAYNDRSTAIRDLSFVVEPGQTIGVVGHSGSGKSTLLNLLLRFYDPQAGKVLLDGHDLRTLRQQDIRRHIGIVTQEAFLFNTSIRENLCYGCLDADDPTIYEAAKQANAHDFILSLPDGYDTLIGERGVKLSGGQRQRLSIARAFLANPEILLLDEATASVEPESEMLIQNALQRLMKGRTTVVVSHRLSMVRDADRILVIDHGVLSESGSHDELMARADGWYARMYRLQMEGGELLEDAYAEVAR